MFRDWRDWGNCVKDGDVATINCLPAVFYNLINAFLALAGVYAVYLFILGGYKFIMSDGDAKKLESARANLIYGTLGLAIILTSFLIIRIVSYTTGVQCILSIGFNCK